MKMIRAVLLVALLLSFAVPTPASAQGEFAAGWYQLNRVIDGDTIRVAGLSRSVRFAGINAPEIGQRCAAEATDTITIFAGGSGWVYLEPAEIPYDRGTDRYRAYVWASPTETTSFFLQEEQLFLGLARMDRTRPWATATYYDLFDRAESSARNDEANIWGSGPLC